MSNSRNRHATQEHHGVLQGNLEAAQEHHGLLGITSIPVDIGLLQKNCPSQEHHDMNTQVCNVCVTSDLIEKETNADDFGSKITKLLFQELRNAHFRSFKDAQIHQHEMACANKEIKRLNKLLESRGCKATKSSENIKDLASTSQVKESSKADQRLEPKVSSGVELNGMLEEKELLLMDIDEPINFKKRKRFDVSVRKLRDERPTKRAFTFRSLFFFTILGVMGF